MLGLSLAWVSANYFEYFKLKFAMNRINNTLLNHLPKKANKLC